MGPPMTDVGNFIYFVFRLFLLVILDPSKNSGPNLLSFQFLVGSTYLGRQKDCSLLEKILATPLR